jgi:hypothetical protein
MGLACLAFSALGCASTSVTPPAKVQERVDAAFEEVVPIQHLLDEYNDYIASYMPRNAEAGYPWAVHYVASQQPPVSEREFRAALETALVTGTEERGLVQIDGIIRPRTIDPVAMGLIREILLTGDVPRQMRVETVVKEQRPEARTYTFMPMVRVSGNEILIRQVYLAAERPEQGELFDSSESWLPSYSHRRFIRDQP